MPRNSNAAKSGMGKIGAAVASATSGAARNPRTVARAVLGILLVANLAAAAFAFNLFGGSPEDLEREMSALRVQLQQRLAALQRSRGVVSKVERARLEGDQFMAGYFLDRRNAYSTIVSEINQSAEKAGLRVREHSFSYEPVEGSDTLSMLTITGNYEGSYPQLVRFLNQVDRSPRLLIVDTLQAAPQQNSNLLNVAVKLNAFVREDAPAI